MHRSVAIILCVLLASCTTYRYVAKDEGLAQNWDEEDRRDFYHMSQGSQLVKYDWFVALEQPANRRPFLEDGLGRFGYLADPFPSGEQYNPDNLPIGFSKDEGVGYKGTSKVEGPWVGMTCAACHTAKIEVQDTSILIDGAAANADFFALIKELSEALTATTKAQDPDKFSRFAKEVLNDDNPPEESTAELEKELQETADSFAIFLNFNTPPLHDGKPNPWGKARLDAVTVILNSIAQKRTPEIPGNIHEPSAPVSYPFIWDSHQQPHNQWNGRLFFLGSFFIKSTLDFLCKIPLL